MNRVRTRRRSTERSPKGIEGGARPKITIEGNLLVLRWTREEAAQAMDAAGMTLDRVIAKYLIPAADATKTIYFRRRGQITERREVPDLRAQFRALKLMLELQCERVPRRKSSTTQQDFRGYRILA